LPENISSAGIGIKIIWSPTDINNQIKDMQKYLDTKHLDIKINLSQEAIKGLEQIGKSAQSTTGEVLKLNNALSNSGSGKMKTTEYFIEGLDKAQRKIEETKLGVGQLKQVFSSLNDAQVMTPNSSRTVNDYGKIQLATEKLIVAQNTLRNSMRAMGSIPALQPQVTTATDLVNGLNINSSAVDQQKARMAVDEVTNAYRRLMATQRELDIQIARTTATEERQTLAIQKQQEKYNLLFAEIRAGASSVRLTEDQMVLLQDKLSAISVGPQAFTQLRELGSLMRSLRSESNIQFVTESQVALERQQTAELQRQVLLYQEANALALRNMQAQYGSLARTPTVQSQISAVQTTVGGLSSSVLDAEGFRTQSTAINSSIAGIRTGLNEARESSHSFGADLVNNGIKMLQWTIVGGLIFGTLSKIKEGFSFINDLDKQMTNISMVTGKSRDSIMEMTKAYADLATQLHTTTSEVMTAAQEFLRAGHTQEETLLLISSAQKMSAISGQDSKSSADQLIAITNGFAQEFAQTGETTIGIIDKLTAVDNMSATSTKELGTALERTSVSAQMAGTSFSNLVSYIATVSSVSRKSASSIGESFNVGGLVA